MSDAKTIAQRFQERFAEAIPYNRALGLRIERIEPDRVFARLPWREELVGHPELRILHGGAISAAMDAICGASVFVATSGTISGRIFTGAAATGEPR